MQKSMSEYRVTLADGTVKVAIRDDAIKVAESFENKDNRIFQMQLTKDNIDVEMDEVISPVHFVVSVTPASAVSGGCIAAPRAYTVPSGAAILFEAIPGDGFAFAGWFLDAPIVPDDTVTFDPSVPISTELKYQITITAPNPGEERKIEARFAPAV